MKTNIKEAEQMKSAWAAELDKWQRVLKIARKDKQAFVARCARFEVRRAKLQVRLAEQAIKSFYTIIAQRLEDYPGQYAPETLDAIDEYGNDKNPMEWAREKVDTYLASNEFESVAIIPIFVDTKEIVARLRPNLIPLKGEIVKE